MTEERADGGTSRPATALPRIVGVAAIIEAGTGLALLAAPAIGITLLAGSVVPEGWLALGRCFGISSLALGIACWPNRRTAAVASGAFRALLTYNTLIALYLGLLGTTGQWRGVLLWPAIALHVLTAFALILRRDRSADA